MPELKGKYMHFVKSYQDASGYIAYEWAKDVRDMARKNLNYRLTGKGTGHLWQGIYIDNDPTYKHLWYVNIGDSDKGNVPVESTTRRYAPFIESGFAPHWIPIEYMQIHTNNPGQIGSRLLVPNPSKYILVSGEPKLFMATALKASKPKEQLYINTGFNKFKRTRMKHIRTY